MRKMLKLLIALVILYFIAQQVYYLFSKGHAVNYIIKTGDKTINVEEVLEINKTATDGYYIGLNFDDYNIPFKIYKKYIKRKRIVASVDLYYGDAYVCAKINIKNKENETDIKCNRNGIVYYYSTIKGYDTKLDQLIADSDYNSDKYINDEFVTSKDNISYFPNNFIDKQNMILGLYKGVYLFGKSVTNGSRFVQLFDKDQYVKTIEGIVDGYYVVANYNDVHEFLSLTSINISNGTKDEITSQDYIPFTSYIQGAADGKLYILDIDNKKQYAVDPKRKNIEVVGNSNTGAQIYTKDGWVTKNMNEVIDSKMKFENNESTSFNNVKYDKVKLVGDSIYYLYKANGNQYNVYMIYKEDKNYTKNYVFTTTDINRISYVGGNVYYIFDDEIRVFTINSGIKKLVKYNEIKYNTNLNFYVY